MEEGSRSALSDAWPLFGLVIRTPRLVLRLPTEGELIELLQVAKAGVHDPEYMPFGFGWTDLASPDFERGFMQYHWRTRAEWSSRDWTLDLGVWVDGRIVGTQGIRGENFPVFRRVGTGSYLGKQSQGLKIGLEMRSAVLAFSFDHLEAERATSEAFMDNAPSIGVSRSLGYADNGFRWMAPRGEARQEQQFLMTREMWQARERMPIEVDGLDACRDMFGV
ncbi:MAG TPA: GNAT family N-acetyltransferase [Candidatus Limnocylindrales bacterium]|jgi:RimJ/RimL family protein N-acetyltransferase